MCARTHTDACRAHTGTHARAVLACTRTDETNFLRVARVASNSVTPPHAAELFRSVLFGMDEASRVTAASSHEIQSRIFAAEIEEFLKDDAAGPSRLHGLLALAVNMYEPDVSMGREILDLESPRKPTLLPTLEQLFESVFRGRDNDDSKSSLSLLSIISPRIRKVRLVQRPTGVSVKSPTREIFRRMLSRMLACHSTFRLDRQPTIRKSQITEKWGSLNSRWYFDAARATDDARTKIEPNIGRG